MAIKPEADHVFFMRYPEQRALAVRLDEAFDITFGSRHGDLFFWLAQPTSRSQERFGLQKEVLIIYSNFPVTDARVLTAVENIARSPDFKHRVDRVLTLIVHSGDEQRANDLAKSDPERVIVPIAAEELLNPNRGPTFVRSRLATHLGAVDLFGMSSPLTTDKYFFGRSELVQQLARRSSLQHQNSGLFGLRKTGKTSVLYAIGRTFESQPVLFEYFDCENPGIHNARWWDALANVAFRLTDSLQRVKNRRANLSTQYTAASAGVQFVSDLKAILQSGGLEQVVIAFDEIEYITPEISGRLGAHWDEDFLPFWQSIRAAHQELQGQLTYVVAGVNPRCIQQSHFGSISNPIFQSAQPYYLEPLTPDAVRVMIRTLGRYAGLAFDEDCYPYLRDRYGGHPYLMRLAASEVWKANKPADIAGPTQVVMDAFEQVRPQILERLAQPIKDILLSLVWWYTEEYELLQILASGDEAFVSEYIRHNPGSLVQFAHYGLLRAGSGAFAIDDIRGFLVQHGESYKQELSPFRRSDMPPEMLPEVPDLAVLGRLFARRCDLEIKLRRALLMYLGIRHELKTDAIAAAMCKGLLRRSDRPNPKSLFEGRLPKDVLNELYLLDLKEIVAQNWDVFCNLFGNNKSRFEMNMDTVNKARQADSHTKPVTAAEAEEFENSYQWLLGRLRALDTTMGDSM